MTKEEFMNSDVLNDFGEEYANVAQDSIAELVGDWFCDYCCDNIEDIDSYDEGYEIAEEFGIEDLVEAIIKHLY